MHQAFPAQQPYFAAPPQPRVHPARPVVYQQPQPRPQPPRPAQTTTPIAARPRPNPAPVAYKPVELPPPEQLGIRLDEPAVVPPPEKLGIRLD
jgi:hypothetical protein